MLKQMKLVALVALVITAFGCGQRISDRKTETAGAVGDFSAPLRVSTTGADAAEPAIATGANGAIFMVWVEHRAKREADVVFARMDEAGKAASAPVRVNQRAGEATAWRGDPPTIASAPDGTIYVGWTARAAETGHATLLYLSTSRDGGRTFDAPVRVNDDTAEVVHGMHSLAVDAKGKVYVAWLDERNVKMEMPDGKMDEHKMEANREVYAAVSSDGGRSFAPNRLVAREACPCCKTATAVGGDGRVYVGWRQVLPGNYRHIAVSSSADGGQTFSAPVIASDDRWMIAGCPVSGPALAVASDASLRVLWYSAGEAGSPGLYWSESKDEGKTFTERKSLTDGSAFGTPLLIAGPNRSVMAVWESNRGGESQIVVARLDGTRPPVTSVMPSRGQLPTAVIARDEVFITYITKQDEQRSIWLVRAKALA